MILYSLLMEIDQKLGCWLDKKNKVSQVFILTFFRFLFFVFLIITFGYINTNYFPPAVSLDSYAYKFNLYLFHGILIVPLIIMFLLYISNFYYHMKCNK
ncbi:hypothetical protein EIG19_20125 [Escherichia coli O83:H15]|nr:hypothetical protein [Escherichia coli O83:H15]